MTKQITRVFAILSATTAVLLAGGCGSSGGGAGGALLQAGAACAAAEAQSCGMAATSSAVLVCSGGAWQPLDVCGAGTLCKADFSGATPVYSCSGGTTTDTQQQDVPDTTGDVTTPDTTVPDTTVPDSTIPDSTIPDTAVTDVPETTPDVQSSVKTLAELQAMKTACANPPVAFDNFMTGVAVNDVVVTSPLRTLSGFEGVFVQDQGGGAWSGIYLMMKGAGTDLADLKPGDVISVVGAAKEYYCFTELQADSITASGANQTPTVLTVSPSTIAEAAAQDALEPYESVLVRLENVVVSDSLADGTDGKPHGDIYVGTSDSDKLVRLGGGFGMYLTEYDKTTKVYSEKYPVGTPFASVTGVLEYSYGQFKLIPVEPPVIAN
jgi:predicted extracellular nuclease